MMSRATKAGYKVVWVDECEGLIHVLLSQSIILQNRQMHHMGSVLRIVYAVEECHEYHTKMMTSAKTSQ